MDRLSEGMEHASRIELGEFTSRAPDEPRRRRVRETVEMAFAPQRERSKEEKQMPEEPLEAPEPQHHRAGAWQRSKRKFQVDPFTKRLLQKSAVCAVLLALVGTVKLIDTPFTKEVAGGIHTALTFEMSIDDAIGKLKFVENEAAKLAQVFAPAKSFRLDKPVQGEIVENFEALGHPYIAITAQKDEFVFVCADGTVKETGTDTELGKYIVVEHADNKTTTYYGLGTVTATKGRALHAGDSIGTMDGDAPRLCLRLTVSAHAVDPAPYLQ
ncbi:MAG: peptidoglycan DD-metalloendopeptidase family protein [Bacillota bacterium]